jgi:hypothetical protein
VDREQRSRRIDEPEECYIRLQLVRGGPFVGCRIFRRLGMLVGEINGQPADIFQIWCGGEFISEDRYNLLMSDPPADPYRPTHVSDAGLAERIREAEEADFWWTRPIV